MCPNKNSIEWKMLASVLGEDLALQYFANNNYTLPDVATIVSTFRDDQGYNPVINNKQLNRNVKPDKMVFETVRDVFSNRIGKQTSVVSTSQAREDYNKLGRMFDDGVKSYNMPLVDKNGKVVGTEIKFVEDRFSLSDVFHEFAHPVIGAIKTYNKPLYNSLLDELRGHDNYDTWVNNISNLYRDSVDPEEELLATLLGANSYSQARKIILNGNQQSFLEKLWDKIMNFIKTLFGLDFNIKKLKHDTTLSELGTMMNFAHSVNLAGYNSPAILESRRRGELTVAGGGRPNQVTSKPLATSEAFSTKLDQLIGHTRNQKEVHKEMIKQVIYNRSDHTFKYGTKNWPLAHQYENAATRDITIRGVIDNEIYPHIEATQKKFYEYLVKWFNNGADISNIEEDFAMFFTPDGLNEFKFSLSHDWGSKIYTPEQLVAKYPELENAFSDDALLPNMYIVVHGEERHENMELKNLDISILDISFSPYPQTYIKDNNDTIFNGMGVHSRTIKELEIPTQNVLRDVGNAKRLALSLVAMKLKDMVPEVTFRRVSGLYFNSNANKSYVRNAVAHLPTWINYIKKLSEEPEFKSWLPRSLQGTVSGSEIYEQNFEEDLIQQVFNAMLNDRERIGDRPAPTLENHIKTMIEYHKTRDPKILEKLLERRKSWIERDAKKHGSDLATDQEYVAVSKLLLQMRSLNNEYPTEDTTGGKKSMISYYFQTAFQEGNKYLQDFNIVYGKANDEIAANFQGFRKEIEPHLEKLQKTHANVLDSIIKRFGTIGEFVSSRLMAYSDHHESLNVKDSAGEKVFEGNKPVRMFLGKIYFEKNAVTDSLGLTDEELAIGKFIVDKIKETLKMMYRHHIINNMNIEGTYIFNNETKTYEINEEEVNRKVDEFYEDNWDDGRLPILTRSGTEYMMNGQVVKGLKHFVRQSSNQHSPFDDNFDMFSKIDQSMDVPSLFFQQYLGGKSNTRPNLLGFRNEDLIIDEDNYRNNDNVTINIESIMNAFVMDSFYKKIHEEKTLDAYKMSETAIRAQVMKDGISREVELKQLQTRFKMLVQGKHIRVLGDQTGLSRGLDNVANILRSYTSASKLAFSLPVMITSFSANAWNATLTFLSNQIAGSPYDMPSYPQFLRGVQEALTHPKKAGKLMDMYRVWDRDPKSLLNDIRHLMLNKSWLTMRTLNLTNWLTDYEMRKAVFVAFMIKEGTWDAHEVVNGEIVYNPLKDKRINPQDGGTRTPEQEAFAQSIIDDLMDNSAYTEDQRKYSEELAGKGLANQPIRAYSFSDINAMNFITGNFIIGAYGAKEVAAGQAHTGLKLMQQFMVFLNTIVENRIGKYVPSQEGAVRKVVTKDGHVSVTKEAVAKEGMYRTFFKRVLRDTPWAAPVLKSIGVFYNAKEVMNPFSNWEKLAPHERYNIVRAMMDVATFAIMLGMTILMSKIGSADDDDSFWNSRIMRAFKNGVMSTLALTPLELKEILSGRKNPIPVWGTIDSILDIATFESLDGPLKNDVLNLTMFQGTTKTYHEMERFLNDDMDIVNNS